MKRRVPLTTHATLFDSSKCAGVVTIFPSQIRGGTDSSRMGRRFSFENPGRQSAISALCTTSAGRFSNFAYRSSLSLTSPIDNLLREKLNPRMSSL